MTHGKLVWGSLLSLCSFLHALLTYFSYTPEILFIQWPGFCLFLNIVQSLTTYTWSKIASSILFCYSITLESSKQIIICYQCSSNVPGASLPGQYPNNVFSMASFLSLSSSGQLF